MTRILAAAILVAATMLGACRTDDIIADDLSMAREAYGARNMPLAERLLERYLQDEQNPDRRWAAWELLLKSINANSQEPRASLECLEAMRVEYENDEPRLADILTQMARYNTLLRHYSNAAEAWTAYIDLADIGDNDRINGLRNLAAMQFVQRHFEAGEETLQQCLALPVPDHDKIYCMLDLADANMARERWEEVADLCQQILDSAPDREVSGIAGYMRADALEQMGQFVEALGQFEQARDSYPNPAVMDNRIQHLKKSVQDKKNN